MLKHNKIINHIPNNNIIIKSYLKNSTLSFFINIIYKKFIYCSTLFSKTETTLSSSKTPLSKLIKSYFKSGNGKRYRAITISNNIYRISGTKYTLNIFLSMKYIARAQFAHIVIQIKRLFISVSFTIAQ